MANEHQWQNFFKEVIDGETHTLVAPPVNDGNHFNVNRDIDWLAAHGFTEWSDAELEQWHEQYDPEPVPYVRQRCTKYQLVTCLRTHYPALLPTLRTAYASNSDLQFFWNTVNDLDKTNDDFKTAQEALGITDEQVTAIFAKIEGAEPAAQEG